MAEENKESTQPTDQSDNTTSVKNGKTIKQIKNVLLALLILILIVDVISYIKPNLLTNLFNKPVKVAETDIKLPDPSLQKGPFTCPTVSSVCQDPKNFNDVILSAKVSSGSAIFAAFDGKIEVQPSIYRISDKETESFQVVTLTNEERGLQAIYTFKANNITIKEIKEGQQITILNKNTLKFYNNNSFVFELLKLGKQGFIPVTLSSADFK